MTIQTMHNLYRSANVTGPLTRDYAMKDGLTRQAMSLTLRNRNATGLKAVASRLAINGSIIAGVSLTVDRAMIPVSLVTALNRSVAPMHLYPAAEVVFGRGLRPGPVQPDASIAWKVTYLWGCVTQYGVAGLVLEALPLRLADVAQARGANKLAMTCMGAAVMGRSMLQIPRALVMVWGISEALLWAAHLTVVLAVPEVTARVLRWGIDHVAVDEPGRPRQGVKKKLDQIINFTSRQLVQIYVRETAPRDDIREVQDLGGHGFNDRVRDRTNAALVRFMQVTDSEVDGGAATLAMADTIAQDLRRYCALSGDTMALRGGLRLLHDFMELTYEELQWPLPTELQALI
jgi:hypothetical protein